MAVQGKKTCFVTVGATAAFKELIRGVLAERSLGALQAAGYEQLLVQYGKDGEEAFRDALATYGTPAAGGPLAVRDILISGFNFRAGGLVEEMALAKNRDGVEGAVISHAGSGSVLAALRVEVPLIVVPNSSLLDNHQLELAEELERQGYVVHGKLDNLPAAIAEVEKLRRRKQDWPPRDSQNDPSGRGLMGVLDDEMGFID